MSPIGIFVLACAVALVSSQECDCKNAHSCIEGICQCSPKYTGEDCSYKRKDKCLAIGLVYIGGLAGLDSFYLGYYTNGILRMFLLGVTLVFGTVLYHMAMTFNDVFGRNAHTKCWLCTVLIFMIIMFIITAACTIALWIHSVLYLESGKAVDGFGFKLFCDCA
jgi:hypothetical protein